MIFYLPFDPHTILEFHNIVPTWCSNRIDVMEEILLEKIVFLFPVAKTEGV